MKQLEQCENCKCCNDIKWANYCEDYFVCNCTQKNTSYVATDDEAICNDFIKKEV